MRIAAVYLGIAFFSPDNARAMSGVTALFAVSSARSPVLAAFAKDRYVHQPLVERPQ
jgi:hypothetical protein